MTQKTQRRNRRYDAINASRLTLYMISAALVLFVGCTFESSSLGEVERFRTGEVCRGSLKGIAREGAQVAETRLIEKSLHRTRWNRKEAAEILKISYKALLYKMKENGLSEGR